MRDRLRRLTNKQTNKQTTSSISSLIHSAVDVVREGRKKNKAAGHPMAAVDEEAPAVRLVIDQRPMAGKGIDGGSQRRRAEAPIIIGAGTRPFFF